uniref:uncharacterized protein LOC117696759 n=1 Tax=Arvicanthis niloticus TaxID=61156 RepID=UPI00402B9085
MEILVKGDMGGVHRSLLCQGPVEITSYNKRKKRYLSLFNDVLVVSSNLKKKFKIKCIIPLNNLWAVDDVILYRGNKNCSSKTLFLLRPTENFFATFRSKEQKDQWYYFLKRAIDKAKKGIKKPFSLQILTENIPTCDSPLCVSATTIDMVNDIMKKLLPMIRVPYIEEYQLWFCPGQWEAPRLLRGQECPHDIILTNLQTNFNRRNSKVFPAFPSLPGLLVNDIYLDAQGQFILKPALRYSPTSQQQRLAHFLLLRTVCEGFPQTVNSFKDSPQSTCWETHMETELHTYYVHAIGHDGALMSLMQIMIDNNVDVLGDDDSTICNDIQKISDGIMMSLNTAGRAEDLQTVETQARGSVETVASPPGSHPVPRRTDQLQKDFDSLRVPGARKAKVKVSLFVPLPEAVFSASFPEDAMLTTDSDDDGDEFPAFSFLITRCGTRAYYEEIIVNYIGQLKKAGQDNIMMLMFKHRDLLRKFMSNLGQYLWERGNGLDLLVNIMAHAKHVPASAPQPCAHPGPQSLSQWSWLLAPWAELCLLCLPVACSPRELPGAEEPGSHGRTQVASAQ